MPWLFCSSLSLCWCVGVCKVLIVDSREALPGGGYAARGVGVGRCKVEARPTLLVAYSYPTSTSTSKGQATAQVFLQQAETVRVLSRAQAGAQGSVAVTELQEGDQLLLRVSAQGTHIGKPIAAQVNEK